MNRFVQIFLASTYETINNLLNGYPLKPVQMDN